MGQGHLTNAEWVRLRPHLSKSVRRGGRWVRHRRLVNGILYRLRTGMTGQDLPARFGPWKTVHERRRRWSAAGTGGEDLRGRPGRRRRGRPDRLVDGELRLAYLPGPPARPRGSQDRSASVGKRRTPGGTTPTRDSDAPGAARLARSISSVSAGAVRWSCRSPRPSGAMPHSSCRSWNASSSARRAAVTRAPGPATSAAIRRTRPAATGATCDGARTSTPSPSRRTSGPTANPRQQGRPTCRRRQDDLQETKALIRLSLRS